MRPHNALCIDGGAAEQSEAEGVFILPCLHLHFWSSILYLQFWSYILHLPQYWKELPPMNSRRIDVGGTSSTIFGSNGQKYDRVLSI